MDQDKVSLYNAPDGKFYSFFLGGEVESLGDDDSDEKATAQGYVSITRVLSQPISLEVDSKVQENLCLII